MAKLQEMGEFVRSASSTIEAPVVRRLKEAFAAQGPQQSPAPKADGQVASAPPKGGPDGRSEPAPSQPAGTPRTPSPRPPQGRAGGGGAPPPPAGRQAPPGRPRRAGSRRNQGPLGQRSRVLHRAVFPPRSLARQRPLRPLRRPARRGPRQRPRRRPRQ